MLLDVRNLQTRFSTSGGIVPAVDDVSWDVKEGETVALVGESGCGKSVSALSIMRLVAQPAGQIVGGQVLFKGRDLLTLDEEAMRRVRGREIAMIFQEPMTSLNPVFTIGDQIAEAIRLHRNQSKQEARNGAISMLRLVGIPNPEERVDHYPHQLSGGQRQRVMIAMALSCEPALLIADEPTTALDVTVQAQVMELLADLQQEPGMGLILITHDLGVVAEMADRVAVMYAGRIVEEATTRRLFATPKHPYTWGLFDCLPNIDEPQGVRLVPIAGRPPNLRRPPTGCTFHPRCPQAFARCPAEEPGMTHVGKDHEAACHAVAERRI